MQREQGWTAGQGDLRSRGRPGQETVAERGMAGNLVSDHAENVLTGEDFSAGEHLITAAAGAGQGLIGGELASAATGALGFGAQVVNAGIWGGLDETAQSGLDGSATPQDFRNGFVSNATSQVVTLGAMKFARWDPDAGIWIEPSGTDELLGTITPALATFGNWVVREEQRKWERGYYDQ